MGETTVSIECSPDIADELSKDLTEHSKEDVARADRQNLGGGLETSLLVLQTAVPLVAAIIPILVPYLKRSKISRLKIRKPDGTEIEIQNPTEQQLEEHIGR